MKLSFTFERGEGVERVTVGPMAIVGYELNNKTKVSTLATTGIGVTDMTELVWRQLELDGREPGSLDSFRRSLVDIDPLAPENPTPPGEGA